MSGAVIWISGLPASGKTTFARGVIDQLRLKQRPAVLLDSDQVRDAIAPELGYDARGRDDFYERLAKLAALLAAQGLVVVVAATASRRSHRHRARELAPRFLEVFLDVPIEECERRDPKQLYQRARADPRIALPGVGAPFEPPPPDGEAWIAQGGYDTDAVDAAARWAAEDHAAAPRR